MVEMGGRDILERYLGDQTHRMERMGEKGGVWLLGAVAQTEKKKKNVSIRF